MRNDPVGFALDLYILLAEADVASKRSVEAETIASIHLERMRTDGVLDGWEVKADGLLFNVRWKFSLRFVQSLNWFSSHWFLASLNPSDAAVASIMES